MNCPNCNTLIKDGMVFCPKCGTKISYPPKCPKCNSEIREGLKFCPHCGSSLDIPQKRNPVTNESDTNVHKTESSISEEFENDIHKKKKRSIIKWVSIVIVLAIAGYCWNIHNSLETQSEESDSQEEYNESEVNSDIREVTISFSQVEDVRGSGYYATVTRAESNYPKAGYSKMVHDHAFSGLVTVPAGEKWIYSRYEVSKYILNVNGTDWDASKKFLPIVYWGRGIVLMQMGHTSSAICDRENIPTFHERERFRVGMRIPYNSTCELEMKIIFKNVSQ